MKKIILSMVLLMVFVPVFADDINSEEINMTPKNSFYGYTKSNGLKTQYTNRIYSSDYEQQRMQIMKPKSVREVRNNSNLDTSKAPMTYEQFPKHMTSDDMMHINGLQNGIQNMYMNF